LATPLLVLRLLARGLRSRPYHRRWPERFGFFKAPDIRGSLWVHAVSVGEVNAAEPLIKALQRDYPEAPLVITTVTPTGTARVQQLFGDNVFHVYLPYDLPFAVRRFMNRIRPRLALIVETEIWPNLYFACRRRGIPLMIVNAQPAALRAALRGPDCGAIAHRCGALPPARSGPAEDPGQRQHEVRHADTRSGTGRWRGHACTLGRTTTGLDGRQHPRGRRAGGARGAHPCAAAVAGCAAA